MTALWKLPPDRLFVVGEEDARDMARELAYGLGREPVRRT